MKEQKEKQKGPDKPILICENIQVYKDPYCYVVTELIGERKRKPSYHPDLPSAGLEVSRRLFNRKLTERADAEHYDFESLVQLVEAHREEMRKRLGL